MIRSKELGNLIAGMDYETATCGCIRLDKDYLWHFGLGDATLEDKMKIVDALREARTSDGRAYHVFVNEECDEPVYYVSRGFLSGGTFNCAPCKHVDLCSKEDYASFNWYGMHCKQCAYDICLLNVPGTRKLF